MRIRLITGAGIGLAMLALGGCASPPRPAPAEPPPPPPAPAPSYPREAAQTSGPAVVALLSQADADLGAGSGDRAIAKLENALRIESRNPFVWQRLAEANLLEHRFEQAESFARRSISLSRGNPWLALQNWRVIAEARRGRGDEDGAAQADGKVTELEERLDE